MNRRSRPSSTSAVARLAVVVALLLGASACGGDDNDDAVATTTTEAEPDETTTTESDPEETTTTVSAPEEPAEPPSDDDPDDPDDPGDADDHGDPLVFVAELTGDTEVPGPGDPSGQGRIEIVSDVPGEWCVDMQATGLSTDVSDAHIHFGPAGTSGDVVIPIGTPTSSDGDTDTWDDVCADVADDLVAEVIDAPDAFYANIHTSAYGAGAIRGQLQTSSIFDLTLS